MKVLVIGSKGNMGRRYMAILKYLGVDALEKDLGDPFPDPDSFDRAIIASPTENHLDDIQEMVSFRRDYLCEKPISKDPSDIDLVMSSSVDGRMVCNWAFVKPNGRLKPGCNFIDYDCYNTGKDGLAWDCIQLVYLAQGMPTLKTKSPTFATYINRHGITLDDIAKSYVRMIKAWLQDPTQLWSLEDAKKATEKVIAYEAMVASRLLP